MESTVTGSIALVPNLFCGGRFVSGVRNLLNSADQSFKLAHQARHKLSKSSNSRRFTDTWEQIPHANIMGGRGQG